MLTTYFSNLLEGFFTVPAAKLQKKKKSKHKSVKDLNMSFIFSGVVSR